MRKFSLLLLALLVVSGAAFAQVVVEPTVEAEGTATFGVDIDKGVSGIRTGVSSTISFDIVEEQTAEFGEGTVYGYIEVEDFEVAFSSDDEGTLDVSSGDVTAKLMLGPAYIELASNIDEVDKASDFSKMAGDIIAPAGNVANVQETEYAGVTLGADLPGLMTVAFSLASEYDWDQQGGGTTVGDSFTEEEWDALVAAGVATGDYDDVADEDVSAATNNRNIENAYSLGLEVDITAVENVSIGLVSNMEWGELTGQRDEDGDPIAPAPGEHNNPAAIGLGVAVDMPMGDMTLSPEFGVDTTFERAAAPSGKGEDAPMGVDIEAGLGFNLTWAGLGIDGNDADYFGLEDQETTSGVGLGLSYSNLGAALPSVEGDTTLVNKDGEFDYFRQNWIFGKLGLYEDSGDDGLLPVVGGAMIVNFNQYLGAEVENDNGTTKTTYTYAPYSQLGLGLELNADLGVVSPYIGFITGTTQLADKEDEVKAGSTTTKTETEAADFGFTMNVGTDINVISDTTFTVDWASGNLNRDSDTSTVYDMNDYTITAGLGGGTSKLGVVTVNTAIEF